MEETSTPTPGPSVAISHYLKLFLPALILFVVIIAFNIWRLYTSTTPRLGENGVPLSQEIEDRYGIRVVGVYVGAKGGLVNLRYRVIDVGKAKDFGHYTENSPLLIAEDSGKVLDVTIMMKHTHRIEAGRIYYILYRNNGNAVQPGGDVTVQIGDLSLEHIPAQ
jgi:hypothetical protein